MSLMRDADGNIIPRRKPIISNRTKAIRTLRACVDYGFEGLDDEESENMKKDIKNAIELIATFQ